MAHSGEHSHSPTNDEDLEAAHFSNVVHTFEQYRTYSLSANNRRRKDFYSLSAADQSLLRELGWLEKLEEVDERIERNAMFLRDIIDHPEIFVNPDHHGTKNAEENDREAPAHSHADVGHSHSHDHSHPHGHGEGIILEEDAPKRKKYKATEFDMDKLRSTLKQFVRDWAAEGKAERDASYTPMLNALEEHFATFPPDQRQNLRVLVPGAGLARLALEVVFRGFACQGNEFSHYMLLSSHFILNRTSSVNQHTIYPYVHSFSNVLSSDTLFREIRIPDILPADIPLGSDFSLVAGDFEEIYGATEDRPEHESQVGKWDAVLTCFFIDTAKNVIEYLRIIHRILAPGGVWINLGPLLWHFENSTTNDISIELTLEEVKALAKKIGFELSNEKTIETTYTGNGDGMLRYEYKAAFWTATKTSDT